MTIAFMVKICIYKKYFIHEFLNLHLMSATMGRIITPNNNPILHGLSPKEEKNNDI